MSTHPLTGGSAAAASRNVDGWVCWWQCNLCDWVDYHRDPVPAIRAHIDLHQLDATPLGATTPTRVSTDVRDAPRSIYDGTRWGR